ncbi:Elongator complex protein 1 [Thelephora ganbajun]|uniref:Elongator complex protein 1 n=1 Tax=Thelephora ganbajun TaxID=370292 RepID=A0ACB6ZEB3_THEGA|nr:Elongator complex protein 1 [Thelephora ganbajun]
MRNLGLRAVQNIALPNATISAVAIDLEEDAIYVTSECQIADADIEVEILKLESQQNGVIQPSPVALFTSNSIPSFNPPLSQVLACKILPDNRELAVILCCGDIITVSLQDDAPIVSFDKISKCCIEYMSQADTVGSIDFGVLAAAWSPDESLLALITGDNKLMLMTSTFDVLSEAPLNTEEYGEDAPINVGWGSKQTQFHGSLGKAAAQAATNLDNAGSSPDDDETPRVSWRGDGAYFVVSALSGKNPQSGLRRRILRVYNRDAALQSTSEAVAGLEHTLSWRPSGNLIVSTQRFGFGGGGAGKDGRHDVVFFERNGLRHGEFNLREPWNKVILDGRISWGYSVKEVGWSSDSNILSIWIRGQDKDVVQLWTTGNYHWYLKQEIESSAEERFTQVLWHPEDSSKLILATPSQLSQRTYGWETWVSVTTFPNDTGTVAVMDGVNMLLTPFRSQNVPPPMSSYELVLPFVRAPIHASFSPTNDTVAFLWESGLVQVWNLQTRLGPGSGKIMNPIKVGEGTISVGLARRVSVSTVADGKTTLAILGSRGNDVLAYAEAGDGIFEVKNEVDLPGRGGTIPDAAIYAWQDSMGQVFRVDISGSVSHIAKFPEFCPTFRSELDPPNDASPLFIGLSKAGKLHAATCSGSTTLATNANSFCCASGFVIYATTTHEAHFVPIRALFAVLSASYSGEKKVESEVRRVERGSRIVTAASSNMALVLQMPRGNLETVNPRPLVLEVVRRDVDSGQWRKAFLSCRKHRIDLNILVEHNPDSFFSDLSKLVEQIDDVDYINLFLTSVGRSTMSTEMIARVCDSVRTELEKRDLNRYINSILTAYVFRQPPDCEAGLALLLRIRESAPHLVEDAVKYIIFLVDANTLFDLALGMYDFSLVLMIAQHAQKDPREYLPFLRGLRSLETNYQKFKIDDHLKRYEKALRNLSNAGPDRFGEATAYVEKHRLYDLALSIWEGTENYKSVLNVYGEHLFERREFSQAALVFVQAEDPAKAMISYEKALEWRELFDLAVRESTPEDELAEMGLRVADDLSSKRRYAEAATVLLDYAGDVRQAVITCVEGNFFADARRIVSLRAVPELMEEIIHPGTLETKSQLIEDLGEMKSQLSKQVVRVRELRVKQVEQPDAFYGNDDVDLQNIDVMTDFSMVPTAFMRYTVAPSTASKKSRKSSRSRRKAERKVGSGRKGTVDEEEYLLQSIVKMCTRLGTIQGEAGKLLPHMLQFTDEHREEGKALQEELVTFQEELSKAIEEVWTRPPESASEDATVTNGTQNPTVVNPPSGVVEAARPQDPLNKIAKPQIVEQTWRVKLWDR